MWIFYLYLYSICELVYILSIQIDSEGHTIVKCVLCGSKMTQSKNDSELFLCYPCNERIYKSELKVKQTIVPKRESKTISYKDEFIDNAFNPGENDLSLELDVDLKSYSLLNQSETNNVYDALELKDSIDKIKIKDMFKKLLENKKVKVSFNK